MKELYYVFQLVRDKPMGPGPTTGTPYKYNPILVPSTESYNGNSTELPPFATEEEAVEYISKKTGVWGPLAIVKVYRSTLGLSSI